MARTQGSHSGITGPRMREAASRLFAQHGYAAVSMRRIAAEVGVQAGALYNYTPDKQTLLFDLMKEHLDQLLVAWSEQSRSADATAALETFMRFHIRFHAARPDAVFIAYMELRNLTPQNFAAVEALRRSYEMELEDILRQGIAQGVFAMPDPKIATLALIAMLTGVNTWFSEDGRLSLPQVEDLYWNMVRKSVGARSE